MDDPYIVAQGAKYKVVHCKGAKATLAEALRHVKHPDGMRRKLIFQFSRLADGHPMTQLNFPSEGGLPDGSSFNAIKKLPIRAYCWLSAGHPKTFFISHYIYKDFTKLKKKDCDIVCENWKRIEEERDEY